MSLIQNYTTAQLIKIISGELFAEPFFHVGQVRGDSYIVHSHPHRVQCYAIGLINTGILTGAANLDAFTVQAGQLLIITPDLIHAFYTTTPDFSMRTLVFTEGFLVNGVQEITQLKTISSFGYGSLPILDLTIADQQRLNALLNFVEQYYASWLQQHRLSIHHFVQALIADIDGILQRTKDSGQSVLPQSRSGWLVNQFRQLVNQHYLTKRQVADYADLLMISTKHLSETIKSKTGKPASFWIDSMLLQEAQVLLRQTTLTISEIAYYFKFSSQSAFGKFFRKKMGISPIAYRQIP